MNNNIGIDFSLTKPAATILERTDIGYQTHYLAWPRPDQLSEKRKLLYEEAGVKITTRTDTKNKETDSTLKMNYEVQTAIYLADLMVQDLLPFLHHDTRIAFEGLSFGSTGDAVTQLSGYKYILMERLMKIVPLDQMFTYAPITIKKTAGCSKRGLKKKDMIDSFIHQDSLNHPNGLGSTIENNLDVFMKKGMKNYIEMLDDIVDSYWALQTLLIKEGSEITY